MRVGQKIKQVRLHRGLTQKELGMMVGFDEKSADIRIAQYETSVRTPKANMRKMLSHALEINPRYFQDQDIYTAEGIMSFLFELDGVYGIDLTPCKDGIKAGVGIHVVCNSLDGFLIDWLEIKQALVDGAITKQDYIEWILTWPEADGWTNPIQYGGILMERKIRRGDMFYADLALGVGSEQSGYRPIVIIQNDTGNKHSNTVIAAIITSRTANKAKMPTHCPIKAQQGLGRDSLVLLEQIRTIDKTRLKEYIGALDSESIDKIDRALAVSVGLKGGA